MRLLAIALITCLVAPIGRTRAADQAAPPWMVEYVYFRYDPSFSPPWEIQIERDAREKIAGEIRRCVKNGPSESDHRRVFELAPAKFDELVSEIESKEFKDAAEKCSVIGNDGEMYSFGRRLGKRHVAFDVWTPTLSPDDPCSRIALRLARKFLEAAAIRDIRQLEEEPNKAAEPSRTTVTAPASAGARASGAPGSP